MASWLPPRAAFPGARWIVSGLLAGLAGAALMASSMELISGLDSGMGQELFNAAILMLAVGMLARHNIWMAVHGRELAAQAMSPARAINEGTRERAVSFIVVALVVLREGSETVLFLYSLAISSPDGLRTTLSGGLSGLAAGARVGGLLYAGLLHIPLRWLFSIASVLVLLLVASMASQAARFLIQADGLPSLVGYDAQPAGMQIVFYVVVLELIGSGMWWQAPRSETRVGIQLARPSQQTARP